ncbi:MAG TPA: hypothetical protein DEB24_04735, partial [Coriobacteriia bacterium]|nr:hypothetical protein [Coriobacteriia bacterium]
LPVINHGGSQPPSHTAVMPSAMVGANGQPISARSAARAAEEEKRKKRNRLIIIGIVATVAALAIIIAILFAVLNGGGEKVEVPNVVGMTQAEAQADLESRGFKLGTITMEVSTTVAQGQVISSDPSYKAKVSPGTTVNLVVSSGPEPPKKVKVPDLRGRTLSQARQDLEALKLVPQLGEERFDADIPVGSVCAQDVAAGTELEEGQKVTYHPSKGKETVGIPNVIGQTEAAAKEALEAAGFKCVVGGSEYSDDTAGTVINQRPLGGNTAAKGTEVTITVSKGPEPPAKVTVPNVIGMTEAAAKKAIEDAGLVCVVGQSEHNSRPSGEVINQSPSGGTSVDKGSTVTIGTSSGPASTSTNPPATNQGTSNP